MDQKVGRWSAGTFIEYERVADYWGNDLPVNRGQNNFQRIRIEFYQDRTAGFEAQILDADGRKGHLLVTFPLGGTYRVDVLKEPLNHPVVWMEFGPVNAVADTVALKMGALHDRALPRDVLEHTARPPTSPVRS